MFADAGVEQVAPRLQLLAKRPDALLRSLERADASVLHDRRHVARGIEQHLLHPLPKLRVLGRNVPEAQAGHRVRLAEREHGERALVHAGQRRRADVRRVVEHDVFVRFVGDEPEIPRPAERGDGLDILARQDATRGVLR